MVGSTVYGFEDQLSAIVAQLVTLGYDVINSHTGRIKVDPNLSNFENCLKAVEECDLFLGIIRPYYGTGNIREENITFEEIKRAIELKKPYWFLVHRDVVFARQLLKKMKPKEDGKELFDVVEIKQNSLFDPRCIEIYEYVIKNHIPVELRNGNWAQEFYRLDEMMTYVDTQFSEKDFVKNILKQKEANNGQQ
ncbi:MAG: DUF4062 domain-containing protein [Bacteroidota bacterium]|nr:DUF4062 domain-containing protein [Bacteroidota bacterium]